MRTASQSPVPDAEKPIIQPWTPYEGIWHGIYRVGYSGSPDFTTEKFTATLFTKLGQPREELTHVLQYTALKARKEDAASWINGFQLRVRRWAIETIWTGIDDAVGGMGKGWNVPIKKVVRVADVAEV